MSRNIVFYTYLAIRICCLHMRQLMVDKYQWNHCEFSFWNKSDILVLVYLYTRSDDRIYCFISLTREYLLEDMSGHTMKKIHINVYIVKRVFLKNHLKVHVISHITKNNYQCIYCVKPFLNNIQIKDNHLLAHAGEKIY